jgi:hypothetical protein
VPALGWHWLALGHSVPAPAKTLGTRAPKKVILIPLFTLNLSQICSSVTLKCVCNPFWGSTQPNIFQKMHFHAIVMRSLTSHTLDFDFRWPSW